MEKEIVIVTTTDAAYVLNCYISVYSITKVANQSKVYRIFVLVTGVCQRECEKLESLSSDFIYVKCIDVANVIKNFDLRETEQFPISIYYRLFIPLIFPEYRKILYIDADTCVLRDLAELYENNLEGCAMGAVHDIPCEHLETHDREIGGMDCRKTFNSGVLLIDLKVFEQEKIREKCMALLLKDYQNKERKLIYPDNDALNLVLYEKYKILDNAWNFQVQYMWKTEEIFEEYRELYKKTSCQPYILHYTGKFKPWSDPDLPMADVFWRLARETSVYDEMIFKLLMEAKKLRECIEDCKVFTFPYGKVPYGSKVAIYGAGMVGQAFYNLMQFSHYVEITLWVDRNHETLSDYIPVVSPSVLLQQNDIYQYLIVAIDKKEIADEIIKELLDQKPMLKEKIVWTPYKNVFNIEGTI